MRKGEASMKAGSKALNVPAPLAGHASKGAGHASKGAVVGSEFRELHFVTVLPDGTEVCMSSEDGVDDTGAFDLAACRQIALRVELLSRGLVGRGVERQTV